MNKKFVELPMPESFLYFETFFVELEAIIRDYCNYLIREGLNGMYNEID
jgi:hypothetical protein